MSGSNAIIPAWSELGSAAEEEMMGIFDTDVEWLLSAKEREQQEYYERALSNSRDPFLKDFGVNQSTTQNKSESPVGIAMVSSSATRARSACWRGHRRYRHRAT